MKHLIIGFLLVTSITFSQSEKGLGFRAGVNISRITNAGLDSKTNAYFGAFYQVRFSDIYALQPEIGYSNQGGKSKLNEGGSLYVEYLTLGLTNKLFFAPNTGFYMSATPEFAFDIDDTLFGLINRNDDEGNDATFIDFNLALGFGFEFKNGLTIEARYKQGLIDIYSGSFHNFESEQLENETQLNSVFQIGIAYKFKLSKKED